MDGVGKSQAFADALARARQLAAKLGAGNPNAAPSPLQPTPVAGIKRGFDDYNSEPEAKRPPAAMVDPFGAQLAAMRGVGGGFGSQPTASGMGIKTGLGIGGTGKACTEEIRIPDPLVGLIIGRGGEQINRIQTEAGCKVQLAPDNGSGQDRPCYLQGTKEAIERAKDMVMDIVSSKSHEIGSTGRTTGFPGMGTKGTPVGAGSATAELMIPGSKVGLIIGKGGETIRNLQDKSGTKMFILQENMFEECDKPLRIVGEPDLVEHARQLVLDLISETPSKSDFGKGKSEYGSDGGGGSRMSGGFGGPGMETMKFPVPKVSVGLIIGKGGDMIKRIQMETGAKVQFDPINSDMGDMDEQLAIITGKSEQIKLAQLKIEELVETALYGKNGGREGEGGGHRGGGGDRGTRNWEEGARHGGGGGGGGGSGGGFGKRGGDYDEDRMIVPVARVGMIIGKGGETIRTINQTSGAHCEIDRNLPQDGPERTFVIKGNRQQIEHAKELITEKINTFPPKGGRGGSGGGEYGQQQNNWGESYGGGGGGGSSGGGGQWSGAQGPNDPSKMGDATAAQWAAYYAQYYGQAQATATPGQAQPDYTQQWVEYLRAQGNHQQADLLEQQAKAAKGGVAPDAPQSTVPPAPAPGTNGNPAQTVDYSQQWAEHYRSIGKIQEAEAIEAYIKTQKGQTSNPQAGATPSAQPQPPTQTPQAPQPYQNQQNYNYGGNFNYPYGNAQPGLNQSQSKSRLTPPGES